MMMIAAEKIALLQLLSSRHGSLVSVDGQSQGCNLHINTNNTAT